MNAGVIPAGYSLSRHKALLHHRGGRETAQHSFKSSPQNKQKIAKLEILFLQKQEETVTFEAAVYYFYYKHAQSIKTS